MTDQDAMLMNITFHFFHILQMDPPESYHTDTELHVSQSVLVRGEAFTDRGHCRFSVDLSFAAVRNASSSFITILYINVFLYCLCLRVSAERTEV